MNRAKHTLPIFISVIFILLIIPITACNGSSRSNGNVNSDLEMSSNIDSSYIDESEKNKADMRSGEAEGLKYETDGSMVIIIGTTDDFSPSSVYELPTQIEGIPVKAVGDNAFSGCEALISIQMPSITEIGANAFINCEKIKTVTIPAVETLNSYAFRGCSSLISCKIPACTKKIGENPFYGCLNMQSITVESGNTEYVMQDDCLMNKSCDTVISCPYAYGDIILPNTCKVIGEYAFAATELSTITAEEVTTVSRGAFCNCKTLISINLNKASEIGENSFMQCDAVYNISLPGAVTIKQNAFFSCLKLRAISMPNVTTIEDQAFCQCKMLRSAEFPKLTRMGNIAFEYCTSLETVDVSGIKTVGAYAFDYCMELKSIDIPNAETIYSYAFRECVALKEVNMPMVKKIDTGAFTKCIMLENINMPAVETIENAAFESCKALKSVTIPKTTKSIGSSPFICCDDLIIRVDEGNQSFEAENGALYSIGKSRLISYPSAKGNIILSESVVTISNSAFYKNSGITSIKMPKVKLIDAKAFMGSSIKSVEMPEVNLVKSAVFHSCLSLERVEAPILEEMGVGAFYSCWNLKTIKIPNIRLIAQEALYNCSDIGDLEMPSIKKIGDNALYGCKSLQKLKFTVLSSIGANAFTNCIGLKKVYFYGNAPETSGSAFVGCGIFTLYYVEGTKGWDASVWSTFPHETFTPELMLGDANADYMVNTYDAVTILKLSAGLITISPLQMSVSDVNHDGAVDTADAVQILRYAAGMDVLE